MIASLPFCFFIENSLVKKNFLDITFVFVNRNYQKIILL